MSIELQALVGVIATVVSTSVLIPSVISQLRHKSPGKTDISVLVQVAIANLSWIVYALLDGDVYVLGRALIAGVISSLSIYLYYKYKKQA
jgi:uncharacterized protein with PQ loop repeat